MSKYINRLTLVVPESLMDKANQLALIMGESAADVNTFVNAGWQDVDGNLYSVCSFVSKPIVLGALSGGLPDELPSHAEDADVELAQEALDSLMVYAEGATLSSSIIVLGIDIAPLEMFDSLGLTQVQEEELL